MTFSDFRNLAYSRQFETLSEKGVLIGERKDYFYRYLLVQVDGFYTELKQNPVTNRIEAVKSFTNMSLLTPYLEQIYLPDFF